MPLIDRNPAPMLADYAVRVAGEVLHCNEGGSGGVLGFIVFFPVGPSMLLENVAVCAAARGKVLGNSSSNSVRLRHGALGSLRCSSTPMKE